MEIVYIDNHIVISTTFIQSGVSMNIITDKCLLKGTARSFTKEQRDYLNSQMYQFHKSKEQKLIKK